MKKRDGHAGDRTPHCAHLSPLDEYSTGVWTVWGNARGPATPDSRSDVGRIASVCGVCAAANCSDKRQTSMKTKQNCLRLRVRFTITIWTGKSSSKMTRIKNYNCVSVRLKLPFFELSFLVGQHSPTHDEGGGCLRERKLLVSNFFGSIFRKHSSRSEKKRGPGERVSGRTHPTVPLCIPPPRGGS